MRLAFAVFAVLMLASGVNAQVAVSAYADRTVVEEGDAMMFMVEVTGSDDVSDIDPPAPSRHLRLQSSTPALRQRSTFGTDTRLTLGWRYIAVETGRASLGAMRLRIGGQTFSTDRISIDVVPRSSAPPSLQPRAQPSPLAGPPASAARGRSSMFIRAEPRQSSPVVGEQVIVDYVLYFDPAEVSPRQAVAVGTWDAPGFWREEMDVPTRETFPRPVTVGGRNLRAVTVRRLALFPARAGTLELAEMEYEVEVREADLSNDPFAPLFSPFRSRRVDREVVAPSTTIRVTALPGGAPPAFSGAVGEFEMIGRISPQSAEPGEAVRLALTLRGTGNAATLAAPEVTAPTGVDLYDPQSERTVDKARSPLQSTRTFTYTFVPQGGSFEVPEIAWTYYDPEAREYRTLRQGPFPVTVVGAAAATVVASGATSDATWQRAGGLSTKPLWALLGVGLVLPAVAALGLVGARRTRQRPARDAAPDAATRLADASALSPRDQAVETERTVRDALAARLGPTARTLPRRDLIARAEPLAGPDAARALDAILARCEAARYAGASGAGDLARDARSALAPFQTTARRRFLRRR